jgi:hypothetical protein
MRYHWLKDSQNIDLLPEDYREIVAIVGLSNFIKLLRAFDKSEIYFSKRSLLPLVDKYILMNASVSARKLAKELKISVRYIYNVRKKERGAIIKR